MNKEELKELLYKLRFFYGNNGSGYNSDFTLTLQKAADLIQELTEEPVNKTQWYTISTAPEDCEVFDVYAQGNRYTDCIFGRCTYGKGFGIIYESYYDCDGAVYELVKYPEYWTRFTPPAASNQWLIRKEPGTKDTYYIAEGTPPDEVLVVYGITK